MFAATTQGTQLARIPGRTSLRRSAYDNYVQLPAYAHSSLAARNEMRHGGLD